MILAATTSSLEVILAGAITTNQLPCVSSWVDITATAFTPGHTDTQTNGATAVTLVAAPGASTQRQVKYINIYNADTVSATVTVRYNANATLRTLAKIILLTGESLIWDGQAFKVLDASGSVKTAQAGTGRYLSTTVLTTGTIFTTGPQTTCIYVRMVGGGGGGGGCTSLASAASAAGGGGAGSYAEKTFVVTPKTAYTYAIGAAGAGNSGAAGGNGGNTTFAVAGLTVTAPGGTGGPVATASTALTAYAGGAGGAIATNGDLNGAGAGGDGGKTLIVATPVVGSGQGGSSPFGRGGIGITAVGAGAAAIGYGSGGGGAATGASAARAGGVGVAGVIIVDEYA
jgi:hypothetical protein